MENIRQRKDFTENLETLVGKINGHLNPRGARKTDVLLFTTPGDQTILYQKTSSWDNR